VVHVAGLVPAGPMWATPAVAPETFVAIVNEYCVRIISLAAIQGRQLKPKFALMEALLQNE